MYTLLGMLIMGKVMSVRAGQRVYQNSLCLPLNFAAKLKLLRERKRAGGEGDRKNKRETLSGL